VEEEAIYYTSDFGREVGEGELALCDLRGFGLSLRLLCGRLLVCRRLSEVSWIGCVESNDLPCFGSTTAEDLVLDFVSMIAACFSGAPDCLKVSNLSRLLEVTGPTRYDLVRTVFMW
jgi:hypothetical protein